MRILIVDALYPRAIEEVYSRTPGLVQQPYAVQLKAILAAAPTSAAHWLSSEIGSITGAVCTPVFFNCAPLQRRWAGERELPSGEHESADRILKAQILAYQPNVVIIFPLTLLPAGFLRSIPGSDRRLLIGWDGVGARSHSHAAEYDIMLSCVQHIADFYITLGCEAYSLITGFDPVVRAELGDTAPSRDSVFVGSVDLSGFYRERFELLIHLMRTVDTELWLSRLPPSSPFSRYQLGLLRRGRLLDAWNLFHLARKNRGSAYGYQMLRILAQARITINQHGHAGGFGAGNRRLWEATGLGSCLVTDWTPDLRSFFEPDKEVVVYRSKEECAEKVRYLLDNNDARRTIALAGMRRTHRDYNTRRFAEKVCDIIARHA